MSRSKWIYSEQFNEDPKEMGYYGFVYLITNLQTRRKYIGKKFFWSRKTYQVKGKKKRKLVESDWRTYWGSNAELIEDIKNLGEEFFEKQILHFCSTKSECAYLEAKEQFERNVLLSSEYYNSWISVKITKKHMNKYAEKIGLQNPNIMIL